MTEENTNTKIFIAVLMGLLLGMITSGIFITVSGDYMLTEDCLSTQPQIPKGTAMVDIRAYDWFIAEDTGELVFQFWVTNYGDTEARNLEIDCGLYDTREIKTLNTIIDYGNIASKSILFGEVTTVEINNLIPDALYAQRCYVKNCDNCIILTDLVPSFYEVE